MYSQLIDPLSEVYTACRHISRFHMFTQHWSSSDTWKVVDFEFFKFDLAETIFPDNWEKFGKGEYHNPWEGFFSVK